MKTKQKAIPGVVSALMLATPFDPNAEAPSFENGIYPLDVTKITAGRKPNTFTVSFEITEEGQYKGFRAMAYFDLQHESPQQQMGYRDKFVKLLNSLDIKEAVTDLTVLEGKSLLGFARYRDGLLEITNFIPNQDEAQAA